MNQLGDNLGENYNSKYPNQKKKKNHCYTIYLMPFLQHDDHLKQVLKFASRVSLVAIAFFGADP